jgi:hypothetical protein
MPHETNPQHASHLCTLPSASTHFAQIYFPFLCIQVIVLFVLSTRRAQRHWDAASPLPLSAGPNSRHKNDSLNLFSTSSASSYSQTFANISPATGIMSGEKTHRGRNASHDFHVSSLQASLTQDTDFISPYTTQMNNASISPVAMRRPRLRVPVSEEHDNTRWIWTFTFRGQRRRLALPGAIWLQKLTGGHARGNVWREVIVDLRRTLWVPVLLWASILWWYA